MYSRNIILYIRNKSSINTNLKQESTKEVKRNNNTPTFPLHNRVTNNTQITHNTSKNCNIRYALFDTTWDGVHEWLSEPRTQHMLLLQIIVVLRPMNLAAGRLFKSFQVQFHCQYLCL